MAQIIDLQKQLDAAADDARSKALMQDWRPKRKAYIDARNHVSAMLKDGDVQGALKDQAHRLGEVVEVFRLPANEQVWQSRA